MRNHELVPTPLIERIAGLRHGGVKKLLGSCCRNKLLTHDSRLYDGYMLTYAGYDVLALRTYVKRNVLLGMSRQIGVGKESDIYLAVDTADNGGNEIVLKLHRLGRTSFRQVKNKRDYLKDRKTSNWLYLSRLSALKEFAFMKALHAEGFPTPTPIDCNRHTLLMTRVEGYVLYQLQELSDPLATMTQCLDIIVRLAEYGLVHGDFNEFNLMVTEKDEQIVMIDFPQMISTSHLNAEEQFNRDVNCIHAFFGKRFGIFTDYKPQLSDILKTQSLDVQVEASGFTKKQQAEMEQLLTDQDQDNNEDDGNSNEQEGETEEHNEEDEEEEEEEQPWVTKRREREAGLKPSDLAQLQNEFEEAVEQLDQAEVPVVATADDQVDGVTGDDAQSVRSFMTTTSIRLHRRELADEEIRQRVKQQMAKRDAPSVIKLAKRNSQKGRDKRKLKTEIKNQGEW